jgi:hypothetical protein
MGRSQPWKVGRALFPLLYQAKIVLSTGQPLDRKYKTSNLDRKYKTSNQHNPGESRGPFLDARFSSEKRAFCFEEP